MDVEETVKNLQSKLDLLSLERDDTEFILQSGNVNEVKNQIAYYEDSLNEIRNLQREVKRAKISAGEPLQAIKEWDMEITERKRSEEELYHSMAKVLDNYENAERHYEVEKLKLSSGRREEAAGRHVPPPAAQEQHARMPKLVISKFQGTHRDWFRFWNQFQAEIDKTNVNQVTKFSYLKELLVPRVHSFGRRFAFHFRGI